MEINDFAKKVCKAVKNELGEAYTIELKEVTKNNGVILHGLLIFSSKQNVIPTIYLDSFWEAYESGTPFAVVIRRLLEIYLEDTPRESVDMDFFRFFDRVKSRICYRLIGRKGNEKLLEDVPHIDFMDLAICFFYAYRGHALGEGSILIHNSHLEMWDTDTAELFKLAQSNTPKLFVWECNAMEAVLGEEMGDLFPEEAEDFWREIHMSVLSNDKRIHGAACMLYPGVLEKLAVKERSSFYILPSSIHEVILLRDTGDEKAEALKKMICEVNSSLVAPEEVLSDSLYYYDFVKKSIQLIF